MAARVQHQRSVFQDLTGAFASATENGDDKTAARLWLQLGEELDKVYGSVGQLTNEIRSIVETGQPGGGGGGTDPGGGGDTGGGSGGGGGGGGNPNTTAEKHAPILSGHAVVQGSMLYFSGGSVGLADASNADRICDAYCTRIGFVNGNPRAYWKVTQEMVKVKLAADQSGLTPGQSLYLSSTTPGALSADAQEELAVVHQHCARFVTLATDSNGNALAGVAIADVHIIPPASLPVSAAL